MARKLHIFFAAAIMTAGMVASASGANLIPVVSFDSDNGASPYAGLILGRDGNFYGTTSAGGPENLGTVFRLTPSGQLTTLASFNGTNGAKPWSRLTADAQGNLYGTTTAGGSGNLGTVFRIAPDGTLNTLVSFNQDNGAFPWGALTLHSSGDLYGTTLFGGVVDAGAVFKMTPGGALTTLVQFDGTNGAMPRSGVIFDTDDNLYGVAGALFRRSPDGTYVKLVTSYGPDGAQPYGDLTMDAAGNLYGTTGYMGGVAAGSVYKLTPGGTFSILAVFDGDMFNDRTANPVGGVIVDAIGQVFGTTYGNIDAGAVFRINLDGTVTILAELDGLTGANSRAMLVADADGNLWGTAAMGGPGNLGAIFKITDTGFVVPEPSTLAMVGTLGMILCRRRRR